MFALRAWARDEGLDHPQLNTAIRNLGVGRADKENFKAGFGELLMLLPSISPATIVDADLKQPGLRALGLGVVVFGRLTLGRFLRKQSAGALAAMQAREDAAAMESLARDRDRLQEVTDLAALLLTRVTPSTSAEERVYPGLFGLRADIEAALQPSALEEIAKATISGELPAISPTDVDPEDAPRTDAATVISDARIPVVLRPSIGLALHGLVIWSRGGSFLPEVDAAIRKVDLAPGLKGWFERGAGILSSLPPEFDPVDLAEAEVDSAGMAAAAMGTLVYSEMVRAADPTAIPDLAARATEALEFATYLVMCIEPEASALHPGLIVDLEAIRREHERKVAAHDAADEKRTAQKRSRWKIPAVLRPDFNNTGPLFNVLGVLAIVALGTTVGLRYWTTRGPPPPASYVDIVPIVGMIRVPGEVTTRVQSFRLGETREDRAYRATALWFRLTSEDNDPRLKLRIQDDRGGDIAVVSAGNVKWAE